MVPSLRFLGSVFWRGEVVIVGVPLLYGFGVGAMYADDYIVAAAFYFVALAWGTAKAVAWEEVRGHANRKGISALMLLLGGVCFVLTLVWISHRSRQVEEAKQNQTLDVAASLRRFVPNVPHSAYEKSWHVPLPPKPKMRPEDDVHITLEVGPSVNPRFAFETRFILTNHSLLPLTRGSYVCAIAHNVAGQLNLNEPANVILTSLGAYEDLPSGRSRSLYCNFVQAEALVATVDPLVIYIEISYTYQERAGKEAFKFFAKHTQEGTFVWYPAGAAP